MTAEIETADPAPRAPGRPRSAAADRRILDAALRLLLEVGYTGLSLEGVAAAAGVGKTTIYRRYHDKRELAAAAVSGFVEDVAPSFDTGDARADLLATASRLYEILSGMGFFRMMGTLLVEERRNPELLERFRERVIQPNRARIRTILEAAQRRGDVRPDADLEIAVDTFAGALIARHLTGPEPSPAWMQVLIDQIWHGIAIDPREPHSTRM
ncbi:MAG: TetR/AcrR family transcriptional regulator [Dehalococcoidia bacterium]